MRLLALLVCAASFLVAGCHTTKGSAAKSACGHKCCRDAHTDCAHCPTCSAKK